MTRKTDAHWRVVKNWQLAFAFFKNKLSLFNIKNFATIADRGNFAAELISEFNLITLGIMAQNFIKKWDGMLLDDWGSVVSPEYNKFQNAMVRELRRIAKSIGAEISKFHKGHYDLSAFFKRGDHYVYFSYSTGIMHPRSMVVLSSRSFCGPVLIRTAADDNDYRGGSNNYCPFSELGQRVDYLLNDNHKPAF